MLGVLSSVLWNINIITSKKRKIYSTIFQNIVLYGSETCTLKKRQKERLLALEMDFWRRFAGKSRLKRVRNETIKETMNVKKNIIQAIEEKNYTDD